MISTMLSGTAGTSLREPGRLTSGTSNTTSADATGAELLLRRKCQVLSWALARSAGERSRAWARLAALCEGGLFRPRHGVSTGSPRAGVAPCRPAPLIEESPGLRLARLSHAAQVAGLS